MSTSLALRFVKGDTSPEVMRWLSAGLSGYLAGAELSSAFGLDRVSLLKTRNRALKTAARLLGEAEPWELAKLLSAAIKRFETRSLPLYEKGLKQPTPVDEALIEAFGTGCRIPKSHRKLYDLLR